MREDLVARGFTARHRDDDGWLGGRYVWFWPCGCECAAHSDEVSALYEAYGAPAEDVRRAAEAHAQLPEWRARRQALSGGA